METAVRYEGSDREKGPWDQPKDEQSSNYEQALLLWDVTREDPNEENFEKFVAFTNETGLTEVQVRRLRWFLVDHPDDEIATHYLREVAQSFQQSLVVAQASSRARAQNFEAGAQRFKQKIMIATAVFWGILVVVMVFMFLTSR